MTLKTAKKRHKELWDWLSKNPKKGKWQWPMWRDNGGKYRHVSFGCCFACEISQGCCDDCPIIWPKGNCCTDEEDGLYDLWSLHKTIKLATQIRDLPWKDEVKP